MNGLSLLLIGLFFSLNTWALHTPRGKGEISKDSSVSQYTVKFLSFTNTLEGQALQQCTGTFISGRTILTAAHCVENANSFGDLFVIFFDGSEPVTLKTIPREDYKTAIHPFFSVVSRELSLFEAVTYDIGLITFKKETLEVLNSAVIYDFSDELESDPVLKEVLGLGAGQKNIVFPIFKKLREELNTFGGQLKATALDLERIYLDSAIYNSPKGYKVCEGDSGGPVLVIHQNKVKILGVLSAVNSGGFFSKKCGTKVFISFAANDNYDWLIENLEILEGEF